MGKFVASVGHVSIPKAAAALGVALTDQVSADLASAAVASFTETAQAIAGADVIQKVTCSAEGAISDTHNHIVLAITVAKVAK